MYSVKDFIDLTDRGDGYEVKLPTLSVCAVCHGVVGVTRGNKHTNDKQLAYEVALLAHGYWVRAWEGTRTANIEFIPYKCKCECDHEWDEVTIGNCLHRWTCRNCGHSMTVDSSG